VARRAVLAAVLWASSLVVLAQATGTTTGDIRGKITEESGAGLPGVVVTATSAETGLTRSDTTATDGTYTIRLLPPGVYTVSTMMSGFQPVTMSNIRVTVNSSTSVDSLLRLSGVT
jgi:hypothetical protein